MSIINMFNNLCETLDISSMFLFWGVIVFLLLFFLAFLTIALICRNRELTKIIINEKDKDIPIKKEIIEKKEIKEEIEEIKKEHVEPRKTEIKEEIKKEEVKENIDFISQLSKKLSEARVPQTIDLTDYEKEQEQTAIISYKELMKNKDRLFQITEDEEDIDFLNELKSFRDSLE